MVKQQTVVIATSSGNLYNYDVKKNSDVLPPEDDKTTQTEMAEGSIVAISMDERNEEGMVGTSQGKIFYVCLKEKKEVKQQKIQV